MSTLTGFSLRGRAQAPGRADPTGLRDVVGVLAHPGGEQRVIADIARSDEAHRYRGIVTLVKLSPCPPDVRQIVQTTFLGDYGRCFWGGIAFLWLRMRVFNCVTGIAK